MASSTDVPSPADPFDLNRFLLAQDEDYATALAEIKAQQKRNHWMWYIFPQIDGLGHSPTSKRYAIKSLDEARAYLNHPVLGSRLLECANAVLEIEGRSMHDVFGFPDDQKLRSCATLFAAASPAESVFQAILSKHYDGRRDEKTLQILEKLP